MIALKLKPKPTLIGMLLLITAYAGIAMKPTKLLSTMRPEINLEASIPKSFGGWRMTEMNRQGLVDPQLTAQLKKLYSQSISRSYLNDEGEMVMLSIVYGRDQRYETKLHPPEVCYEAQGFQISKLLDGSQDTKLGTLQTRKFVATRGGRVESVTYWVNLGGVGPVDKRAYRLARFKMGLTGIIPDALLYRVSTIGTQDASHASHEKFIKDLLVSIHADSAKQLLYNSH